VAQLALYKLAFRGTKVAKSEQQRLEDVAGLIKYL
jgi:hypothetical protein